VEVVVYVLTGKEEKSLLQAGKTKSSSEDKKIEILICQSLFHCK
jgi:hypothetical protein